MLASFWQVFSYKNGKIEKTFFYIFPHISGLKIGTETYFTLFESWKPKRFDVFYTKFSKNQ